MTNRMKHLPQSPKTPLKNAKLRVLRHRLATGLRAQKETEALRHRRSLRFEA
jgi:hypothetical protein